MHFNFWDRLRLVAAIIAISIAIMLLEPSERWMVAVERRQEARKHDG